MLVGLTLLALTSGGQPDMAHAGVASPADLRVGTSGDYAPFSDDRGGLRGFDVALARAWAESLGKTLEFVRFRWPRLLPDLAANRFDVAMSGITMRPERSLAGRFSLPVAETGAVVLVPRSRGWGTAKRGNQPGIRIAVNAGGHLQRVAEEHFPAATLVVIPDNRAVLAALLDRAVDAAVSDTLEAPGWLAQADDLQTLGPFTLDRKAPLLRPDRAELGAQLDRWLLAREADGTLARLRREAFGPAAEQMRATATPLEALLAAIDERLSLMPAIALAKQQAGLPLEVPQREAVVRAAGAAAVERAIAENGGARPTPTAVQAFFQAQMNAAKQVQKTWLQTRSDDPPSEPADLDAVLRPALLRIGERIAGLIPHLPGDLEREPLATAASRSLRAPLLSKESRDALVQAIFELSRSATPGVPAGEVRAPRVREAAASG